MEKLKTRVFFAFLIGAITGLFIYSISNNETVRVMNLINYGIYGYKAYIFVIEILMLPMIIITTTNATRMILKGLRNSTIGFYTLKNFVMTTVLAIVFSIGYSYWIQFYAPVDLSIITQYTNSLIGRTYEIVHLDAQTNIMRHIITPEIVSLALLTSVLVGCLSEMQTGAFAQRLEDCIIAIQDRLSTVLRWCIEIVFIPVFIYVMTVFGIIGSKAFSAALFYGLGLFVALIIFGSLMYGALITIGTPIKMTELLKKIKPLAKVISKTSSSTEVLPVTISTVVNKFYVEEDIASFVLRLGQNMNRDGTAILHCFATVVMAKFYGIQLDMSSLLVVGGLTFLLAQGSFNIPYDGILTMSIIFYFLGIPVEGILLVLGVDKGLEITRIVINVTGDIITAIMVENWSFKK